MANATFSASNASEAILKLSGPQEDQDLIVEEGTSLTVGSHESCDLRLKGSDVSAMHCVLKYLNGVFWVQDWNTRTGTLVEGQRITGETPVADGSLIEFGSYRLMVCLSNGSATALRDQSDQEVEATRNSDRHAPCIGGNPLAADRLCPEEFSVQRRQPSDSQSAVDHGSTRRSASEPSATQPIATEVTSEESISAESSDEFESFDWNYYPEEPPVVIVPSQANRIGQPTEPRQRQEEVDNFSDETLEMYREEIASLQEQLRIALQERDGLRNGAQRSVSEAVEERTSARIDELTEELSRTDERIANLEELLMIAEEASLAEQEERRQIESWLGEVEVRVGEREAELSAENDVLRKRVEEAVGERNALEARLQNASSPQNAQVALEETLTHLREQNSKLRRHVERQQEKFGQVEQELANLRAVTDPAAFQQRLEEALREERLQIAQERAALARQRVTIAKEVENMPRGEQGSKDAEKRFEAFRQHLREIHEQESKERKEQSIGSRLARLWKRLD